MTADVTDAARKAQARAAYDAATWSMPHLAQRAGIPFVLIGPSGVGKSTLCRLLCEGDPKLRTLVSHTTRIRRELEADGVAYHFVSREKFHQLDLAGEFVETATYAGQLYGASKAEFFRDDLDILCEMEDNGALAIRALRPDARLIFIHPPAFWVLAERMQARGSMETVEIARRLEIARRQIASSADFDYAIVNDDKAEAASQLRAIIAEARG